MSQSTLEQVRVNYKAQPKEVKSQIVTLRMTPREYVRAVQLAERLGLPLSELIRQLLEQVEAQGMA